MLRITATAAQTRATTAPSTTGQGRYENVDDVGCAYRDPSVSFAPLDDVRAFYRLGEAQFGHLDRDSGTTCTVSCATK